MPVIQLFLQLPVFLKLLFVQLICSGVLLQFVDGSGNLFCLLFQMQDLVLIQSPLCSFQFLQGFITPPHVIYDRIRRAL